MRSQRWTPDKWQLHPCWVLLCRSACQSLKGAPWMGSCSVVQCLRCLMGQPLYCSAADAGLWGERSYGEGSSYYAWLSSIALLPWLPGFPPQAFLTTVSSFTSSWSVSPQSTAILTLGSLHNPQTQHPCLGYVWLWQGLSDFHSI